MSVLGILNRLATFLVLAFFVLGLWQASEMVKTDKPIYESAIGSAQNGNWSYLIDAVKMGWGWQVSTPTIKVGMMPWYIQWYGLYANFFLQSGFIPIPGFESFLFIGIILLAMLPVALVLKRRSGNSPQGKPLGLPIWFFGLIILLIVLLYPLWCWINLNWFFIPGAMGVFGIDRATAYSIWLTSSQSAASFSWFFAAMGVIGIYKGVVWGTRFRKW